MAAAVAVHPARQRAVEGVAADRQTCAEAAVDEVAAAAVVEAVPLDHDVVRPAVERDAVDERSRAVAAVGEVAAADRHPPRVGDQDRRRLPAAAADDEIVEHDIAGAPELDERVAGDRADGDAAERDVLRAVEVDVLDPGARRPDDPERTARAGRDRQAAVEARPQHDRPARAAERSLGADELRVAADPDRGRAGIRRSGRDSGRGREDERRHQQESSRPPAHRREPSAGTETPRRR